MALAAAFGRDESLARAPNTGRGANADEHRLGLSPRIPDYAPTSGRDTDGDGFTDAQELTAGTNHLDRTQFPPFTLHIISGSSQVVKIHQEFPQPLVLEARRADGTPQPGIALTVTTSRNNNLVLLAGSAGTDDWWPRTLQTTTGADGRATIRVKAPNTAGALTVTATAAIKTTTKAAFSTMVNTLIGDADGDGMPDARAMGVRLGITADSPVAAATARRHSTETRCARYSALA